MASRPQGPLGIFEAGEALFEHTAKAIQIIEGALSRAVPSEGMAVAENTPTPAADHGGHEESHQHRLRKPEHADVVARPPDSETRECENCGKRKPIEEMSTVFLPGTGESYQCEECRGYR